MHKKAHFYVNYKNMTVLKFYLEIIKKSLTDIGFECDDVLSLEAIDKKDLIVFPMGKDAFKFYLKGFKNFIIWQQGVTAEESFMRNHSKIRFNILNFMDCFTMKKAKMIFFCSDYMKNHYENLSKISFNEKSCIMPCFNTVIDEKSFDADGKYKNNVFAYVGSLSQWQCFSQTVDFYKVLENEVNNAELRVFTSEHEEAEKILKEKNIKNYSVSFVSPEKLSKALYPVKFGFVLRDDIEVNRVATPTKLSSYMASGVIPVFSDCLCDFKSISEDMKFVVAVKDKKITGKLINLLKEEIDSKEIKSEYSHVFKTYYNPEYYINEIKKISNKVFA